ncbi:MAG: radical SAM protein, partial [bacterium]
STNECYQVMVESNIAIVSSKCKKVFNQPKVMYYYLFHQPVATMKTTWGCWYKCNFCYTWKITDGMPYSRSPESIVEELERIEANDVYIVDDIFLINPVRLAKLAQLIRARYS